MDECIFAFWAAPGKGAKEALLLARSIRTFARGMAENPIWILVPGGGSKFAPQIEAELGSLNVRLITLALSEEACAFPFAAKTFAAAKAEALAKDETPLLVWLDRDSIILTEPQELLLPQEKVLGYRPVDHTLIGSPFDSPVDDFWELVYRLCDVPSHRIFPMIASVDEKRIRPYFNAGMLVVRPKQHILQSWGENFARLYHMPQFERFYRQDILYQIFIHQAILAGTILSRSDPGTLHHLPHLINYPLHMHNAYPVDLRPVRMNDLITCRYDTFFDDPSWEAEIRIDEPLKNWLVIQKLGS